MYDGGEPHTHEEALAAARLKVTDAVAYLDSITFFCSRRLPPGLLSALRKEYGGRLHVHPLRVPDPFFKPWLMTLHQPRQATLVALRALEGTVLRVNAAHVAIDFLVSGRVDADQVTAALFAHVVQKWRRHNERVRLEVNTSYWKRDRRAARNIALYGDKLSKADGSPCAHFEMRFTSASACKRAGLGELEKILKEIDVMALLKRQTKLANVDAQRLDRAIEKVARINKRRKPRKWSTVKEAKVRIQRLLARAVHDEGRALSETTIMNARAQSLADCRLPLRHCLVSPASWSEFTSRPSWRWLC